MESVEPATHGDHEAVAEAVESLQADGAVDRDQAAILLPLWQRYEELDDRSRAAVIRRFPPAPDPEAAAGAEPRERLEGGGWISGPSYGGPR